MIEADWGPPYNDRNLSDFQKKSIFWKMLFEKSPSEHTQTAIFRFIRLQFFYADKSSELCGS